MMLRLTLDGIREKDTAMSAIVGTVLLLAIAVIIFSGFMTYILSTPTPHPPPNANLLGSMGSDGYIATIEHKGGETVELENSRILILIGDVDKADINFTNGIPSTEYVTINDMNNNLRWDVGEILEINLSGLFNTTYHFYFWQIECIIIDLPSNSIIMDCILNPGIVNFLPPIPTFTYEPPDPKAKEIIHFNASNSFDPDGGKIKDYTWNFGDNTGNFSGILIEIDHIYLNPGTYNVTLTVTDDENVSATTNSNITPFLIVTENIRPVAYFTYSLRGNGWVFFDSCYTENPNYFDDQHSYDPDGTISFWTWDFGNGVIIQNSTSPTYLYQYNSSGIYNVTLVVTDDGINNPLTNSFSLQVTIPNILPVPIFTHTPNPTIHIFIFFNASASFDTDGYIQNYSWDFNNDGIIDAYGINPVENELFSTPGNYTVNLTVTDDQGATNFTKKIMYVGDPTVDKKILIVDNTPHDRGFDGIQNIIRDLNIGNYQWGKAIDQDTFYAGSPNVIGQEVTADFLSNYDIVIWSTGNFPGDGNNYAGNNYWKTPLTDGGNDNSNHVLEIYNYLTSQKYKGGLLLTGTYVARDLQDYLGNDATIDEVKLGKGLGLYYTNRDDGGINGSLHSIRLGNFTDGTSFGYGPIYANGTIESVLNTSSDGNLGLSDLLFLSDNPLYSLIKNNDPQFSYSLKISGDYATLLDDFEGGSPLGGWTIHDADNDSETWRITNQSVYNWSGINFSHSGEYFAECFDGDDDWFVSSRVLIPPGGFVRFWCRSTISPPKSKFEVWVSTTGNSVSEMLSGEFVGEIMAVDTEYILNSFDLSRFGRSYVYIGIRSVKPPSNDRACLCIDDFEIRWSTVPIGNYAIDADRNENPSILCGFDLNAPSISSDSRAHYLRNTINWLSERTGFIVTAYVDNDRPLDWYNQANKSSIQEAINAVGIGGVVYVYNGSEYSPAFINKSLNVIGLNNPVINSEGEYGLKINVNLVIIENITIITNGNLGNGIILDNCNCVTIVNCSISGAENGIVLHETYDSVIENIDLQGNSFGIALYNSFGNFIMENYIGSGSNGVSLSNSKNNMINHNEIVTQKSNGIHAISSMDNFITKNAIHTNTGEGIYLSDFSNNNFLIQNSIYNNSYGIHISYSNLNSIVQDNVISQNFLGGVYFESYCSYNHIRGNIIKHNEDFGVFIGNSPFNYIYDNMIFNNVWGVILEGSLGCDVSCCEVNESVEDGFKIYSSNSNFFYENSVYNNTNGIYLESSSGNRISNNTFWGNREAGIYLYESLDLTSGKNIIQNNSITLNGAQGICFYSSTKNSISNNTITNNSGQGVQLEAKSNSNTVSWNTISNNSWGVVVSSSGDNSLSYNTINNSVNDGVYVNQYSSLNIIADNDIFNNSYGLSLHLSNSNDISSNYIAFNRDSGVRLFSSGSNMIQSCNISYNGEYGIYLENSHRNTIQDCAVFNNILSGAYIVSSEYNEITSNTLFNNSIHGLCLERCSQNNDGNNIIHNNDIYKNEENGVYLIYSNGDALYSNSIWENTRGIFLTQSDDNDLNYNIIKNNLNEGILLTTTSIDNSIKNNTIFANQLGIAINDSDRTTIRDNQIYWHNNSASIQIKDSTLGSSFPITFNKIDNNHIGIEIISSGGTHVTYNIICNNGLGVRIDTSNYVSVQNFNNISFNTNAGIDLISSNNGIIDENIISENTYGIRLNFSNDNTIRRNNIYNNHWGVHLSSNSANNIIKENNISISSSDYYVVAITGTSNDNNYVFWNNFANTSFIDRSLGLDEGGDGNCWYNPGSEDKKGNYWGNYKNLYPSASPLPGGWWNTYYEIAGSTGRKDIRPLVEKYQWW